MMCSLALLSHTLSSGFKIATSRLEKLPNVEHCYFYRRTYIRLSDGQKINQLKKKNIMERNMFEPTLGRNRYMMKTKKICGWDNKIPEIDPCQRSTKLNESFGDTKKFDSFAGYKTMTRQHFLKTTKLKSQNTLPFIEARSKVSDHTSNYEITKERLPNDPSPQMAQKADTEKFTNRKINKFSVTEPRSEAVSQNDQSSLKAYTDKEKLTILKISNFPDTEPRLTEVSQNEQSFLKMNTWKENFTNQNINKFPGTEPRSTAVSQNEQTSLKADTNEATLTDLNIYKNPEKEPQPIEESKYKPTSLTQMLKIVRRRNRLDRYNEYKINLSRKPQCQDPSTLRPAKQPTNPSQSRS